MKKKEDQKKPETTSQPALNEDMDFKSASQEEDESIEEFIKIRKLQNKILEKILDKMTEKDKEQKIKNNQ